MRSIDEVYCKMDLKKEDGNYWQRLNSARKWFFITFAMWLMWCFVVGRAVHTLLPMIKHSAEPPLKGSPQFAVLALVIALAGYLRQLRANALELRDKIRSGEVWNYPLEMPYREYTLAKLEALDGISEKLKFASPFLVWLFAPISGRILFEFFSPLFFKQPQDILFAIDIVIVQWVFWCFVGLAAAHLFSRRKDDEIRAIARLCEDKIVPWPEAEKTQAASN